MASEMPLDSTQVSDHQLGQKLAALMAQQSSSNLPYTVVFNQLQDLLGDDTALQGPLRDLLGRAAFRQMVGAQRQTPQIGARDALLEDLARTYNSHMVERLGVVINGCLGLPPTPVPPSSHQNAQRPVSPSFSTMESEGASREPALEYPSASVKPRPSAALRPEHSISSNRNQVRSLFIAMVSLLSGVILVAFAFEALRPRLSQTNRSNDASTHPQSESSVGSAPDSADQPKASLKPDLEPSAPSEPLVSDAPTEAELQALLQGWLDAKSLTLSGQPADLTLVARQPLVERVELERAADQAAGRSKSIDASITTIEVVDRKPYRIELLAQVTYSDRLQDSDGAVMDETAPTDFIVTYVLGRVGTQWLVHDYLPGT